MPTEKEVYEAHAEQYARLIQREDYQGNIMREIQKIITLADIDVVELGAGTGRLTRLLAPYMHSIKAFDTSERMLKIAEKSLRETSLTNWQIEVADHRQIPIEDASADLVISGWSFFYLAVWGEDKWKSALDAGLNEIQRILRPSGKIIILETLGTGNKKPNPPEHLGKYYDWLSESGFERGWMHTDYRFESLEEAVELSTFFFGEKMGEKVQQHKWIILPECTGIWWKNG